MGFSINEEEIKKVLGRNCDRNKALNAIDGETVSLNDFAALVSFAGDTEFFERLAAKAKALTTMRFGRVKGLYIPLYLSSSCHNVCTYCGFSKNNRVKRKTLSESEIARELKGIYEKGFRNILLVSGELRDFKNSAYLGRAVVLARETGFQSIAVELGALDGGSATLLARSGAQSFVLYQETYHRPTYANVHPEGRKADFSFRLGGVERAIKAGFKQVTLGFLAGLYDPLYEAVALYSHIAYLKKEKWGVEFSMSIPRLKEAYGVVDGFQEVNDRKYAQILMAFRLAFPEIAINLSTREAAEFRDGMANICVTHLSVESKTFPGGYAEKGGDLLEQFSVGDSRSLLELAGTLDLMGYDIHFKDWEMELNRIES
jgi:2-iminoacetate synthase